MRTVSITQQFTEPRMPRSVPSVSAQKHQSPAETPYVHYYFLNHVVLTVRGLHALRKYRRQTVSRRG